MGYTYDQGRDFLAAAQIVMERDITLIGPTTGIDGLFHGAWWYYLLTIPFVLFGGSPIGYYYFMFVIHLVSLVGLYVFLRRHVGETYALLAGLLVATSPYFISKGIFVGNNIMVLPVFLLFLCLNYCFFLNSKTYRDTKVAWYNRREMWIAFLGVSLGFVAEFEVSFGMFLIPSYIILAAVFPTLRKVIYTRWGGPWFVGGLFLPFVPRLVFELRHNFLQTRTIIDFLFEPSYHVPKAFIDIVRDRIALFALYYTELFTQSSWMWIFSLLAIGAVGYKIYLFVTKRDRTWEHYVFAPAVIVMLFLFSLTYKDTFWMNYYEGVQYAFLFSLVFFLSVTFTRPYDRLFHVVLVSASVALLFVTSVQVIQGLMDRSDVELDGLGKQQAVVDFIDAQVSDEPFCLRVYTPPMIPYTYNYLFLYREIQGKGMRPIEEWKDNKCWFIIEYDATVERIENWRSMFQPDEGSVIEEKYVGDITIEHWEVDK